MLRPKDTIPKCLLGNVDEQNINEMVQDMQACLDQLAKDKQEDWALTFVSVVAWAPLIEEKPPWKNWDRLTLLRLHEWLETVSKQIPPRSKAEDSWLRHEFFGLLDGLTHVKGMPQDLTLDTFIVRFLDTIHPPYEEICRKTARERGQEEKNKRLAIEAHVEDKKEEDQQRQRSRPRRHQATASVNASDSDDVLDNHPDTEGQDHDE